MGELIRNLHESRQGGQQVFPGLHRPDRQEIGMVDLHEGTQLALCLFLGFDHVIGFDAQIIDMDASGVDLHEFHHVLSGATGIGDQSVRHVDGGFDHVTVDPEVFQLHRVGKSKIDQVVDR